MDYLKSSRSITHIPFLGKVIEQVVANQEQYCFELIPVWIQTTREYQNYTGCTAQWPGKEGLGLE